MIEAQVLLVAAVLLPFLAAAGINLLGRWQNIRDGWQIICALGQIFLLYNLYIILRAENYPHAEIFGFLPNISLGFALEPLGMVYALVAGVLWLFSIIYSIGYLRFTNDAKQTRFFIFFALAIGASTAIAFSANLIVMFIFYEALTLLTYPLVAHYGAKEQVRAAAKTYLIYLLGSSVAFLLPAIALTYYLTGTLEFTDGGNFYNSTITDSAKLLLVLLFVFGAAKAAVFPLHGWLPKAMVAPAPVSGLLHAVAVVKAGVFVIGKVVIYILGADNLDLAGAYRDIILYIAAFTILFSGYKALKTNDIKGRLAYSTISNLSYIILAFLLLVQTGVVAGGAHIISHAVGKITLFFAAGAIIAITGANKVTEVDGLAKKHPLFFGCFFLCSLSIIGLPFFAGGETKELILQAAADAELKWIVYLLYISMALKAAYLLPISYRAFFGKLAKKNQEAVFRTSVMMKLAVVATTILTLSFPFYISHITLILERIIV